MVDTAKKNTEKEKSLPEEAQKVYDKTKLQTITKTDFLKFDIQNNILESKEIEKQNVTKFFSIAFENYTKEVQNPQSEIVLKKISFESYVNALIEAADAKDFIEQLGDKANKWGEQLKDRKNKVINFASSLDTKYLGYDKGSLLMGGVAAGVTAGMSWKKKAFVGFVTAGVMNKNVLKGVKNILKTQGKPGIEGFVLPGSFAIGASLIGADGPSATFLDKRKNALMRSLLLSPRVWRTGGDIFYNILHGNVDFNEHMGTDLLSGKGRNERFRENLMNAVSKENRSRFYNTDSSYGLSLDEVLASTETKDSTEAQRKNILDKNIVQVADFIVDFQKNSEVTKWSKEKQKLFLNVIKRYTASKKITLEERKMFFPYMEEYFQYSSALAVASVYEQSGMKKNLETEIKKIEKKRQEGILVLQKQGMTKEQAEAVLKEAGKKKMSGFLKSKVLNQSLTSDRTALKTLLDSGVLGIGGLLFLLVPMAAKGSIWLSKGLGNVFNKKNEKNKKVDEKLTTDEEKSFKEVKRYGLSKILKHGNTLSKEEIKFFHEDARGKLLKGRQYKNNAKRFFIEIYSKIKNSKNTTIDFDVFQAAANSKKLSFSPPIKTKKGDLYRKNEFKNKDDQKIYIISKVGKTISYKEKVSHSLKSISKKDFIKKVNAGDYIKV